MLRHSDYFSVRADEASSDILIVSFSVCAAEASSDILIVVFHFYISLSSLIKQNNTNNL